MTKVKAGALQYTVFISYVVTSVLLLFISYRGIKMKFVETETDFFKKNADLKSALILYLTYPQMYQDTDTVSLDIHGDSTSVVHVSKSFWGLWDVITVKTPYRDTELIKSVLAGKDPYQSDSLALFMPDHSQSLYASGNTYIHGNIRISQKGIQKAAIEGKPFSAEQLPDGRILPGQKDIPGLNSKIVNKIRFWQSYDSLEPYSTSLNHLSTPEIIHLNIQTPLVYMNKKSLRLSRINATGQIAFVSPELIIIQKDAILDGVIISSGKVLIEDNFVGNIQVFCRDSIIVGKNCKLEYPSALVIHNEGVNPAYLELGDSTIIEGIIICNQTLASNSPPLVKLCKQSKVFGQIFHTGTVELNGIIHGSLVCKSFYLKTSKAYYIDHLLDNEIDFFKLPKNYIGIDFQHGYNDQIMEFLTESCKKTYE